MSKVLALHISGKASAPMQALDQLELVAGKGVVGDRYFLELGTFSKQLAGLPDKELTLIESEFVEAFNREHGFDFDYGDFRRNIVTVGVDLNALVDQDFMLGDIRVKGIRLCEPCAHLAKLLTPEIMPSLVHKTGLRAQILDDGVLKLNDPIRR